MIQMKTTGKQKIGSKKWIYTKHNRFSQEEREPIIPQVDARSLHNSGTDRKQTLNQGETKANTFEISARGLVLLMVKIYIFGKNIFPINT